MIRDLHMLTHIFGGVIGGALGAACGRAAPHPSQLVSASRGPRDRNEKKTKWWCDGADELARDIYEDPRDQTDPSAENDSRPPLHFCFFFFKEALNTSPPAAVRGGVVSPCAAIQSASVTRQPRSWKKTANSEVQTPKRKANTDFFFS